MAIVKICVTVALFYSLNSVQDYWYPLISWLVTWIVTVCIAWYFARTITRDVLCKKIIPRVNAADKAVLITGCGSGFGHLTATELNRLGFFVFAGCRDASSTSARDLLRLAPNANRMVVLQLDVTKQEEISAAYEKVKEYISVGSVKELFALINNAGRSNGCPIEWGKSKSIEVFERHINVNAYGVIRTTKTFLPLIRKSKGRIINLSSMAARTNMTGLCQYAISKAAISKFTEGLQQELAMFGIKSIDVDPWFHKTPILNAKFLFEESLKNFKQSSEEVRRAYGVDSLTTLCNQLILTSDDPRIVESTAEPVIKALVDAVTSAEPDIVYRIIPFKLRFVLWIVNDFFPWELVILCRSLNDAVMKRIKPIVAPSEMIDLNENIYQIEVKNEKCVK